MDWIRNGFLVLVAIAIGLLIAEGLTRIILGNPLETSGYLSRIMLFQKGPNFRNVEDFFLYFPDQEIPVATYYGVGDPVEIVKEYSYTIRTNNLGLVQTQRVSKGRPSYLVLGDSFTEGQGANPWFYSLETDLRTPLQAINGGLLGTGPSQWRRLHDYLVESNGLVVEAVTLVIIGPDLSRPIWNFSDEGMVCLRKGDCAVNQDDFFGFDLINGNEVAERNFAAKVLEARRSMGDNASFSGYVKMAIKQSALGVNLYFLAKRFANIDLSLGGANLNQKDVVAQSLEDMRYLLDRYPGRTNIVHIPYKYEVTNKVSHPLSRRLKGWVSSMNLDDYYFFCDLEIGDFYMHDDHPNADGYQKILACVERASMQVLLTVPP